MAEIVVGNMGRIVSVALKIKEAVETVQQNKKECGDIAKFVARNSALLKRLEEGTEITMDTVMRDALEDLVESLEEALKIVTECQRRHIIRRFFGAGDIAKELRRVQEDIVQKIMQASFATNIHGTIIMTTHVQHAGAPPPPLPLEQVVTDEGFTVFSLSELKAATNDFSDENIIGRGGSAVIYKGVLRNGLVVAIKKFRVSTYFDSRMFHDEYEIALKLQHKNVKNVFKFPGFIAEGMHRNFDARMFCDEFGICVKLQHKNVVTVLGYCVDVKLSLMPKEGKYIEVEERQNFLVLGYLPNGSLHNIIEGTRRIDWSSCFRMIEGIAKCVCYLHEQRVVHMDLKPENILFDSDMNPVIIDFGLSKVLDHDDDQIFEKDLVGTAGYLAPEQIGKGMVSTKSDVFAFGITLRQIIIRVCITSKTIGFLGREDWDRMVRKAGGVKGLLDPNLQFNGSQVTEIERCMEVALLCTQMDPADRPTIADVVQMLNGEKEVEGPGRDALIDKPIDFLPPSRSNFAYLPPANTYWSTWSFVSLT